ncbi:MAG TPA: contact-dependent growth inhibition system immunity protein [Xanthobacteraceae bacterium]|nr:contact-dependent growth inhibition system immunity protein [Xanthobacteraceae bacterium]
MQQLDGRDWGEPTYPFSSCQECHRLRGVPLRDFTAEDLRITIGQNIGLEYLVPLALERLDHDPFTPGAYYPCDLLVSMLRSDVKFWQRHAKAAGAAGDDCRASNWSISNQAGYRQPDSHQSSYTGL